MSRGRLPLVATVLVVLIGSVFLLSQARYLWFFGDDWAFLLGRDLGAHPVEDLMRPHNEHWSAFPVLIYRAMFSVFGLKHFLPFAMLPIAAHAITCVLLFLVQRRCGVHPWIAVGVTTVLVFLGAGAENLLWSFQVGMLSSAAFGLGALLLALGPSDRRNVALIWLLSVLSLMASGMAIPMLIWLGSLTLLRDGVRRALLLTLPPMGVYAVWFLVWGRGVDTGIPASRMADVVPLAWKGLAATWDTMSGFTGAGAVIVVALLVAAVALKPDTDRRALALSGAMTAVATYLILAQSRGGLGPESTSAFRYSYFAALMTLPALALVLHALHEHLAARPVERSLTVAVVLALLVVPGAIGVVTFREGRDTIVPDLRARVIAGSEVARSGERLLNPKLEPSFNPDIWADLLARPSVVEALPDRPATARDLLTARAALQVAAGPTTWGLPEAKVSFVSTETSASGGCLIGLGATGSVLEIPSGDTGAQIRFVVSATDRVTARLRSGGVTGAPVDVVVGDTTEVYLGVTAPGVELLVDLPPGAPFTVCAR